MANQFQTTVYLQVQDGDDAGLDVTIEYAVEKTYSPSYYAETRHDVVITKIVDTASEADVGPVLFRQIDSHVLRKSILVLWRDARQTDAEIRAELRRDAARVAA